MRPATPSPSRRALALIELLILMTILAFLAAILAVGIADSRRKSRAAGSMDNLRFFAAGTQSYAADHANKFFTFSWTAGAQTTEYPDLNFASSDLQAAANQAVYIMRRLGNMPEVPTIINWIPHIQYSALPLFEHQGISIPSKAAVSPEDRIRLAWHRDAAGFFALTTRPQGTGSTLRWVFSSSYEVGPAFWSPDAAVGSQQTIANSGSHSTYLVPPNMPFGGRTIDQVRFPAHKAQMWDTHQRDLGRRAPFFAMQDARVPVLCVDGSAGLRSARYTNPGFQPNSPQAPVALSFTYSPDLSWELPSPSGMNETVLGRQRYTRSGLRGRDFNGPEVPFSPP